MAIKIIRIDTANPQTKLKVLGIIKKMFGWRFILVIPKNEPETGLSDR
jgi:hypothetical protein